MKKIKLYQVDAFTDETFKGNPAAVCILDEELEDRVMQSIAYEMNLSETAFIIPKDANVSRNNKYYIRWFTPKCEVSLCGHATLAASEILFNYTEIPIEEIEYHSISGILMAYKDRNGISLDFPIDEPISAPFFQREELLKSMGISKYKEIIFGKKTKKLVIHLESEKDIYDLRPDFEAMKGLDLENIKGVGVTARANEVYDFISRYFNPWVGVNEDPVTGSVHTLLASYWAGLLGKKELTAYQASQRSGKIKLRIRDKNRLDIIGKAKLFFSGELYL